jgi:uncharacterized protein YifN (PemK superfamily)
MPPINQINQREIKQTKCDTNGRLAGPADPKHAYIIITKNNYNERANEILGIPLTSQADSYFVLNYGLDLAQDEIEGGGFTLSRKTFIMCDRPCRISKNHLVDAHFDGSKIIKTKFLDMLTKIRNFMELGIIRVES